MPSSKKGAPPNILLQKKETPMQKQETAKVNAKDLTEFFHEDGEMPEVVGETGSVVQEDKATATPEEVTPPPPPSDNDSENNSEEPKNRRQAVTRTARHSNTAVRAKKTTSESQKNRKNYYLSSDTNESIEDMLLIARRHIRKTFDSAVTESALLEIIIDTFKAEVFSDKKVFLAIVESYYNQKAI